MYDDKSALKDSARLSILLSKAEQLASQLADYRYDFYKNHQIGSVNIDDDILDNITDLPDILSELNGQVDDFGMAIDELV